MAPKRTPSSPISIGNCQVTIEASSFTCKSDPNSLQISVPKTGKVKISVVEDIGTNNGSNSGGLKRETQEEEYDFVLANPKDDDNISKAYLQEVLQLYMRELPAMNYASNTGKQSTFLEKCVTNGKYCTMLLKSKSIEDPGKVIASITYQIVPSDTQFAETPLAAVDSVFQRKGLGRMLYLELKNRLRSVGVRTVLCWGDKESQGFWFKQGFTPVAEVGAKGRVRRLPIKAGVQKALCFPGGSTLMVSHLSKCTSPETANSVKCISSKLQHSALPSVVDSIINTSSVEASEKGNLLVGLAIDGLTGDERFRGSESRNSMNNIRGSVFISEEMNNQVTTAKTSNDGIHTGKNHLCYSTQGTKRVWEASLSSLKSKKVKGSQVNDSEPDSACVYFCGTATKGSCGQCSMEPSEKKSLGEIPLRNTLNKAEVIVKHHEEFYVPPAAPVNEESPSETRCYRIMLMNIADNKKKTHLTKVIEDLGGAVTSDGTMATHVVTGKVRKTLNFCTALCSGAWMVSPSWLKESCRQGRFVDESLFILNDGDYSMKYKVELKDAVRKAKGNPRSLLKGFDVCIAAHCEPSAKTLSAIVMSAGGNVVSGLDQVKEASKMIFLACEQDMNEAMIAVKKGVLTFSSEWFMNCVMRQELDTKAPQFAEAL